MFDNGGGGVGSAGVGEERESRERSPLKRRTSCADMRSMWEDHMNKSTLAPPPDQIAQRHQDSLMGKRTLSSTNE